MTLLLKSVTLKVVKTNQCSSFGNTGPVRLALFELIVEQEDRPFSFLIIDTPKQHEIHNDDLNQYMMALKSLAEKNDIQVVFSTTEYHYNGNKLDRNWIPKFPGKEQNMFLREIELIDIKTQN